MMEQKERREIQDRKCELGVWLRLIVSYLSECHLESTISECTSRDVSDIHVRSGRCREIGTMGTISDVHVEVAAVSRRRMYVCVG